MIRKPLLAVAALVLGATGVSLAPTAADAADAGPLLRVTARCDGPGSKMMLGIHPSATGGVVAATRITHVRHPHWVGTTIVGNKLPDDISLLTAQRRVVTDWTRSSQSWPKPVVSTYFSMNGDVMCTQLAESTKRIDTGIAIDAAHEKLVGMRVLSKAGVVEVAALLRPHLRARVAVNVQTDAGFQHRVRFVRADGEGFIDVRFRTVEKVAGYHRALARVMTGHGPSQIIQLARVR